MADFGENLGKAGFVLAGAIALLAIGYPIYLNTIGGGHSSVIPYLLAGIGIFGALRFWQISSTKTTASAEDFIAATGLLGLAIVGFIAGPKIGLFSVGSTIDTGVAFISNNTGITALIAIGLFLFRTQIADLIRKVHL